MHSRTRAPSCSSINENLAVAPYFSNAFFVDALLVTPTRYVRYVRQKQTPLYETNADSYYTPALRQGLHLTIQYYSISQTLVAAGALQLSKYPIPLDPMLFKVISSQCYSLDTSIAVYRAELTMLLKSCLLREF